MSVPAYMRADRAILKRQQEEFHSEQFLAGQQDQFKVAQKGLWENRMVDVIRGNAVKSKVKSLEAQHKRELQDRRRKLAEKLSAEQKAFEKEMVDREETPAQRMEKMSVRAYDLKKRREDERKAIVKEKLYQQWRAGIDDLRTIDSRIVELKVIADRDYQLDEKAAVVAEEKAHDEFYDRLWHEGYLAKLEREEREKELKAERNEQQKKTLAIQLQMKDARIKEDKDQEDVEVVEMKKLWKAQAEEDRTAKYRELVLAKEERKKADEFMYIQQRVKAEEEAWEKDFDKKFVADVLAREKAVAEKEEAEKIKAKKKAVEFTEALKKEMTRKAASEEELIRLQHEESERQWAKRYEQWEKEELARRSLMEEVYSDRAEQVRLKQQMRDKLKEEFAKERHAVEMDIARYEGMEQERMAGEALIQKHHQEELFRQMDALQAQRHREMEQRAAEQKRQAGEEAKIDRAVEAEKVKATSIVQQTMLKRAAKTSQASSVAPWDK